MGMLARFQGAAGASALREALGKQGALQGNPEAIKGIKSALRLKSFNAKDVIFRQGDVDRDVAFILSGSVSIRINDRLIAVRKAGDHVGEMAMLDPSAKRSATVTAIDETIIALVSEKKFSSVANEYPVLWRRLAIELGERLRQRSHAIKSPNQVPNIFIGSSSEALPAARALKNALEVDPVVATLWNKNVFAVADTTIESLEKSITGSDFAVLVISADDDVTSRGKKIKGPRDNVVFELGLFMGALGRTRTYILKPSHRPIKTPSDLLGITPVYYKTNGQPWSKRVAEASDEIRRRIQELGPR